MNNIEKLAERDDDTKMLGNVSTDELEQMAKTHPRTALQTAYGEGVIAGKALQSSEPVAYEVTYANKTVVLVWEENELDPDNVEVWGNYVMEPLYKKAKAYAQQQTEPVGYVSSLPIKTPQAIRQDANEAFKIAVYDKPPATVPEGCTNCIDYEPSYPLTKKIFDVIKARRKLNKRYYNADQYDGAYLLECDLKEALSVSPTPSNAVPLEKYNNLLDAANGVIAYVDSQKAMCEHLSVTALRKAIAEGKEG